MSPTDLTQDFSEQEMSRIAGMLYKASVGGGNPGGRQGYCKIIKQERAAPSCGSPWRMTKPKAV